MSILILVEHDNKTINPATLNAINAATELGSEIDLLVVGEGINDLCSSLSQYADIRTIYQLDDANFKAPVAEDLALVIKNLSANYTHIIAASTAFAKNVMPRVAGLMDVMQISDVIKIHDQSIFERFIYAGNAICKLVANTPVKVLTIRTTKFDAYDKLTGGSANIESIKADTLGLTKHISYDLPESDMPDLATASIVVSGGRGLGSKEKFDDLIIPLAKKLNAAVGASRAAVDSGYCANDLQVGQTGKVVAPSLYIAVGISGAIQHLAGMKDSDVIVAINSDPDAPIFQVADYGLVGDLNTIIPELMAAL